MNALQLQGQTNDSVFQGVPGRLLVLYKFDEVLKNIVGEPILSAVNLENKENRGLWEYTYNLTNGEYLFAAVSNFARWIRSRLTLLDGICSTPTPQGSPRFLARLRTSPATTSTGRSVSGSKTKFPPTKWKSSRSA